MSIKKRPSYSTAVEKMHDLDVIQSDFVQKGDSCYIVVSGSVSLKCTKIWCDVFFINIWFHTVI